LKGKVLRNQYSPVRRSSLHPAMNGQKNAPFAP